MCWKISRLRRAIPEEEAYDLLYNSGLRVYTTCDVEMQDYLEKAFNVDTNSTIFPAVINEEYPEGAFVVLGLDGQIKAIAGSDRTKTGARTFNRARDAVRHPGSTIKPIASSFAGLWKMTSFISPRW